MLMAVSDLPLRRTGRGKVRDIYDAGSDRLLLVTTDRVSAFDVVMAEPIPHKGAVLTQLSAWWCGQLEELGPTHLISSDADSIIPEIPELAPFRDSIAGRAMLCRRTTVFPIECVVRGYLAGSAWKEYRISGTLAGEPLPAGLEESSRLEPPIFSPATKAVSGHDENITISEMRRLIGDEATSQLEHRTRAVYERARVIAESRGIIVADTKLEFGRNNDGDILLIDEVLTPDSSRFWPADGYKSGRQQPSFDKQPLRDYLEREKAAGRWNGEAPPPPLPPDVVSATSERYRLAYRLLTGTDLTLTETW
ncbi:MAG: phosphoribosylaminoimidazolesuccinocarboxamide synthase [Anaerolineae bacterium]|nr:phosphoribosylaminoimidazolesuccinocarboxamide synthase [Gemmatimonadaceae bacterium]